MVRTPGFHPGNRGFDSHRDHHVEFEKYPLRDTFCSIFDMFVKIVFTNYGEELTGVEVVNLRVVFNCS